MVQLQLIRKVQKLILSEGTYNMKCTAIDALHFMIDTTKTIQVSKPVEPTPFTGIDLNINPKEGYAPLTIQYSCEAYGGMNPVSYAVYLLVMVLLQQIRKVQRLILSQETIRLHALHVDALHFMISKSDYVNVKEDKTLSVSLTMLIP
jgi:hypothetical protein